MSDKMIDVALKKNVDGRIDEVVLCCMLSQHVICGEDDRASTGHTPIVCRSARLNPSSIILAAKAATLAAQGRRAPQALSSQTTSKVDRVCCIRLVHRHETEPHIEGGGAADQLVHEPAADALAPVGLGYIDVPQPADGRIMHHVRIAIESAAGDEGWAFVDAEKALAGLVESIVTGSPVGDQAVEKGVLAKAGFVGEEKSGL
ncbi:MAG: hypothetical protein R3D57_08215 [Hyphomicrobiaceae bacterium]